MSSVAPELISVLLGNVWQPAIPAFQLLCLVMPIRMLSPVVHAALQGVGRADVSLRNTLFAAVVMPAAFYVGSKFDLLGLALAWVVIFPLVFAGNLVSSLPYLNLHLIQIVRALALPAVLSAAMYAGVYLVRLGLNGNPGMNLPVLVVVGTASYGLLSLAFNRDGVREIWMMIARRKA
jgi:O-antigen/teichoic acid export membrane protein